MNILKILEIQAKKAFSQEGNHDRFHQFLTREILKKEGDYYGQKQLLRPGLTFIFTKSEHCEMVLCTLPQPPWTIVLTFLVIFAFLTIGKDLKNNFSDLPNPSGPLQF